MSPLSLYAFIMGLCLAAKSMLLNVFCFRFLFRLLSFLLKIYKRDFLLRLLSFLLKIFNGDTKLYCALARSQLADRKLYYKIWLYNEI